MTEGRYILTEKGTINLVTSWDKLDDIAFPIEGEYDLMDAEQVQMLSLKDGSPRETSMEEYKRIVSSLSPKGLLKAAATYFNQIPTDNYYRESTEFFLKRMNEVGGSE